VVCGYENNLGFDRILHPDNWTKSKSYTFSFLPCCCSSGIISEQVLLIQSNTKPNREKIDTEFQDLCTDRKNNVRTEGEDIGDYSTEKFQFFLIFLTKNPIWDKIRFFGEQKPKLLLIEKRISPIG
jgi:hypothetical protein